VILSGSLCMENFFWRFTFIQKTLDCKDIKPFIHPKRVHFAKEMKSNEKNNKYFVYTANLQSGEI